MQNEPRKKTTPQHLRRFDGAHRHATLVAYLTERAGSLADEALDMHDRLMGEMLGKGEKARDENFRKRGKAINEKVGLYASVGKALILAIRRRRGAWSTEQGCANRQAL